MVQFVSLMLLIPIYHGHPYPLSLGELSLVILDKDIGMLSAVGVQEK